MGIYIVILTGASGSAYGFRLLEQLLSGGHDVTFIATDAGRQVAAYELGFEMSAEEPERSLSEFLEVPSDRLNVAWPNDLFDAAASGSHQVDGTIVIPASMGFCAGVASGQAADLPERACDVALKERRRLVLVPREMPLSLIHLRNLTALTEAGAIVVPAMPAFYQRPETIDDLVNFVVGKVLDQLGLEHKLFRRWGE